MCCLVEHEAVHLPVTHALTGGLHGAGPRRGGPWGCSGRPPSHPVCGSRRRLSELMKCRCECCPQTGSDNRKLSRLGWRLGGVYFSEFMSDAQAPEEHPGAGAAHGEDRSCAWRWCCALGQRQRPAEDTASPLGLHFGQGCVQLHGEAPAPAAVPSGSLSPAGTSEGVRPAQAIFLMEASFPGRRVAGWK